SGGRLLAPLPANIVQGWSQVVCLKRVRVQTPLTWWKTTTKEKSHGTRTLAPVVARPPGSRQGFPAQVCHLPALDPGRRRPRGRAARPPRLVALPAAPLVHDAPAAAGPAVPLDPQPPGGPPAGRGAPAGGGEAPPRPRRAPAAGAARRQAAARQQ